MPYERIGVFVNNPPDPVSSKLEALRAYQFSLRKPRVVAGTFDEIAAKRGRVVFNTTARCARCHLGERLTDVNAGRLHAAAEVGQDPAYALAQRDQAVFARRPFAGSGILRS